MSMDNKGYYDFDIEIESLLIQNGMISELFYLKDLQQRKLFINEDINQGSVIDPVKRILQFNKEDMGIPVESRVPILLYVTSNGGEAQPGIELIDTILTSVTPVYTINLGFQYSMGFLIGLAGHKRFAMPNATFLMHDGSSVMYDSGAKLQDRMEFNQRVEERIKSYVLSRTKVTAEEYDSKFRVEWYMFADEAKEKGITDYIIGTDCSMNTIV